MMKMMKFKISAEQKQLLKKAGKLALILAAAFMAVKYMQWNFGKVEQAVGLARAIRKEPPAVNLEILERNKPLLQKSFAYNERGNYYIIDHFDLGGRIRDAADITNGNISINVNKREITSFSLFRFKAYDILYTGSYYFGFTRMDSKIEDLVGLDKNFPDITGVLVQLAESGRNGRNGPGSQDVNLDLLDSVGIKDEFIGMKFFEK